MRCRERRESSTDPRTSGAASGSSGSFASLAPLRPPAPAPRRVSLRSPRRGPAPAPGTPRLAFGSLAVPLPSIVGCSEGPSCRRFASLGGLRPRRDRDPDAWRAIGTASACGILPHAREHKGIAPRRPERRVGSLRSRSRRGPCCSAASAEAAARACVTRRPATLTPRSKRSPRASPSSTSAPLRPAFSPGSLGRAGRGVARSRTPAGGPSLAGAGWSLPSGSAPLRPRARGASCPAGRNAVLARLSRAAVRRACPCGAPEPARVARG
jgi:hypothetical protein